MYPLSRFITRLSAAVALAALVCTGFPDTPAPQAATPPPATASAKPAANTKQAPAAATTPQSAAVPAQPPSVSKPADQPDHTEVTVKAEITTSDDSAAHSNHWNSGQHDDVAPFSNVIVLKGQDRSQAVAIAGDVLVEGTVHQDSVAIAGTNLVKGRVGHDTVAVFGNNIITGSTGHNAVAVFSDLYINGDVGHDAVVVFGTLHLGPKAVIHGQRVSVFGRVVEDSAQQMSRFDLSNFQGRIPSLGAVGTWVHECLLRGRLLAFHPDLKFAWCFAAANLLLYFLIALIFRSGVERCVATVEEKPLTSLAAFFITLLLLPFVLILLAITGIGAVVDVLLLAALFIGMRFGRAVMHAWVGRSLTRYLPAGPLRHVAFSVLVGGVIIALLYCVPVVGLMVQALIGFFGLGAVVLTVTQALSRERKGGTSSTPAPVPPPAPMPPAPAPAAPALPLAINSEPSTESLPPTPAPSQEPPHVTLVAPPAPSLPPLIPPPAAPQPVTSPTERLNSLALPRATFFQRMGALLIDVVLVAVVAGLLFHNMPGFLLPSSGPGRFLLCMAIYGAIFWKLRGTTVGGIILKLQVVRADGRPLDWTTCIVRGLGCLLSVIFAGLGFFWIAIDSDREAWHDKLAGTIVVRVPNHRPLV